MTFSQKAIVPCSILQIADWASTYVGVEVYGHVELNPFALQLLSHSWLGYLLVKVVVVAMWFVLANVYVSFAVKTPEEREHYLSGSMIACYLFGLSVISYNVAQYL